MYSRLQSLWQRYQPGQDAVGRHIRFMQWTSIGLSRAEQASGSILLRHIAVALTFHQPEGETWVMVGGQRYRAERIGQSLQVPPALLSSRIVSLKQFGEGYVLTTERPNLVATQHVVRTLTHHGWSVETDPFDDDGHIVMPALVRATAADPSLRRRPTLPLDLIQLLESERLEVKYR